MLTPKFLTFKSSNFRIKSNSINTILDCNTSQYFDNQKVYLIFINLKIGMEIAIQTRVIDNRHSLKKYIMK